MDILFLNSTISLSDLGEQRQPLRRVSRTVVSLPGAIFWTSWCNVGWDAMVGWKLGVDSSAPGQLMRLWELPSDSGQGQGARF